jgi:histone H3/H4
MKTYVITVIYHKSEPIAYELMAKSRREALQIVWRDAAQIADHINRITAVQK